jgi:hypothetical protein
MDEPLTDLCDSQHLDACEIPGPADLTPTLSPGSPWEKDSDEQKQKWKEITDKCLKSKSPLVRYLAKTADPPPEVPKAADTPPELPDSQETVVMMGASSPMPLAKAKATAKAKGAATAKSKSKAKAKARRPRERKSEEHKAKIHREGSKRWHLKWVSKGVPRVQPQEDGRKCKKGNKNVDSKDIPKPELDCEDKLKNQKSKQVIEPKPETKKRSRASRPSSALQPAPKTSKTSRASKTKQPDETPKTKVPEQIPEERHPKKIVFFERVWITIIIV